MPVGQCNGWIRILALVCACASLGACQLTPEGGSLYHASMEIGNTYAIEWPRRVRACDSSLTDCFSRDTGSLTVDNAAIQLKNYIAMVHLVFDDGRSGWMAYNDFLGQRFSDPAQTRLVVRKGMTSDQIRAAWGEPTTISPQQFGSVVLQKWSYPNVGDLYFNDGKVDDISLNKSLLAVN
jgi:hypothetical protein